jgi:hypothetical protein
MVDMWIGAEVSEWRSSCCQLAEDRPRLRGSSASVGPREFSIARLEFGLISVLGVNGNGRNSNDAPDSAVEW